MNMRWTLNDNARKSLRVALRLRAFARVFSTTRESFEKIEPNMKEKIYKNRKKLSLVALAITIAGGINTYKFYGQEPHETIGGFLVGVGLGLFLIFISLKNPDEQTSNE